jgi:hypothetical protein
MLEQIETSIIAFLLGSVLTYFAARWSRILKKIDLLELGIQAILRDRMCQIHKYYNEKKKPIPQREIDSFESMYSAYKQLGGNGYIEDVRHEVIEVMPHEIH